MLRTNVLVETLPGKAHVVASLIESLGGMEKPVVERDDRVRVTWQCADDDVPEPESLSEVLRSFTYEIVSIEVLDV